MPFKTGKVEGMVGLARRSFMVPIPRANRESGSLATGTPDDVAADAVRCL